ncbi:hypothetical protein HWV62_797 [Athelia sp. TMB]|nr:hypothetical protein HWV62_797 [Athelia sp. TMB]
MRFRNQGTTIIMTDVEAGGASLDRLVESKLRAIVQTFAERLEGQERQGKDLTKNIALVSELVSNITARLDFLEGTRVADAPATDAALPLPANPPPSAPATNTSLSLLENHPQHTASPPSTIYAGSSRNTILRESGIALGGGWQNPNAGEKRPLQDTAGSQPANKRHRRSRGYREIHLSDSARSRASSSSTLPIIPGSYLILGPIIPSMGLDVMFKEILKQFPEKLHHLQDDVLRVEPEDRVNGFYRVTFYGSRTAETIVNAFMLSPPIYTMIHGVSMRLPAA